MGAYLIHMVSTEILYELSLGFSCALHSFLLIAEMSGVLYEWWSSSVNDRGAAAGSFGPKNSTDYINISQAVVRLVGHK